MTRNNNNNRLDELFRKGLGGSGLEDVDEDWAAMRLRLLAGEGKKRRGFYFSLISSAAAIILISVTVFFSLDQDTEMAKGKQNDVRETIVGKQEVQDLADVTAAEEQIAFIPSIEQQSEGIADGLQNSIVQEAAAIELKKGPNEGNTVAVISDSSTSAIAAELSTPIMNAERTEAVANVNNEPLADDATSTLGAEQFYGDSPVDPGERKKSFTDRSRFSLAINASPDMSGVESFQGRKMGYSIGAGVHYSISKKFTLETEVAFTQKNYQTGFSHFHGPQTFFAVLPSNVNAGFEVLDLQLNMAYNIINQGRYSVGLAAGFSSYLMLDEEYAFAYQNLNARGLQGFSTGYQNNHFLGVANVGLRFRRAISPNTRVSINPYFKLPLTDLGYGNVRLRSAGVQIGLVSNLNAFRKK